MTRFHFIVLGVLGAACGPSRAANTNTIPRENLTNCVSLCQSIDGSLQAVVIVAGETGCVCTTGTSTAEWSGATAAAAGGAVVALRRAQVRAQQQQQQQQQQPR